MTKTSIKKREAVICVFVILFVFQSALEHISSVFSYIDELPAFLAIVYLLKRPKRLLRLNFGDKRICCALCIFLISGLIGNILFRYQSANLVFIDILTCFKFILALYISEQYLSSNVIDYRIVPKLANCISIVLFCLFLADRVLNIFPGEIRYGIKSNVLFFDHPTYLAGACVFLIGVLTVYNYRKYKWAILFNMVLLLFTLRAKAIAGVVCYILIYFIVVKMQSKLKVWQIIVVGMIAVAVAWSQIAFYFIKLSGTSARSAMLLTSFQIMRDYFPIGTGFGTYASHSAAVNYSPVYTKYGFELIYELRNSSTGTFFDDQFWPIIFGQTGVIGTICYLYYLYRLFRKIQNVRRINIGAYVAALFVFVYLLISSVAEPAFNNSIAVPLGCVIGFAFRVVQDGKRDLSSSVV